MIRERDTAAYRAIMDSAYGAPKQDIDHSNLGKAFDNKIEIEIILPITEE